MQVALHACLRRSPGPTDTNTDQACCLSLGGLQELELGESQSPHTTAQVKHPFPSGFLIMSLNISLIAYAQYVANSVPPCFCENLQASVCQSIGSARFSQLPRDAPQHLLKGSCSAFRDLFILVAHWEYTLTLQAGESTQCMDYEDGPLHLHILRVDVHTIMLSLFCLKALKRTFPRTRSIKRSCERAS